MKQAHAAGLFETTKFAFPAAGWQHTALKNDFTPEGMIFGHNTLYFAYPNASPLQREFVKHYWDAYKDYPNWEAERAFFAFAIGRPNLYRLMFESDLLGRTPPPAVLIPPADASYRLIRRAVKGAFPDAGEVEVKIRTVIMVSTSHGFLSLENAGRFKPFMYEPLTREEMVAAVLQALEGPI